MAQSQGTVSTTGGSGTPGSVFNIPVTLSLNVGVSVDTLLFGVQVVANAGAPPLTGTLGFSTTISPAPLVAPTGSDFISVAWISAISPALSGTRVLGTIQMTIPAAARNGQTYTLHVSAPDGALGLTHVTLTPGPDSTLTVTQTPASIVATAGSPQSATVNTAFGTALQATVRDALSNPISGATVTFAAPASGASATFTPSSSATTNASGVASVTATANTVAGSYTVTASVAGVATPASFSLTNTAGPAAALAIVSGNNQSGPIGTTLPLPLVVQVADTFGNGVSGVSVAFAVTSGSATLSASSVVTGAGGLAQVTVTLGTTLGAVTVRATATGVSTPVSFSLQAVQAVRTLTVNSSNTAAGVAVTVSPVDNNGQGNGTTPFFRTYNDGTIVTLTAPATAGANTFQKWQRDGVDFSTNASTSLTMDANHTMTAFYTAPPSFTLSVSPASQSVSAGAAATYTVFILGSGGFNAAVTLACTGLPAGASCNFSTNPAPPGNVTFTVSTSSTTPLGTAVFSVTGTSGSLSAIASASLTVSASNVPIISLSPTTLTFFALVGANPPTQSVNITNSGGGTLNWTASVAVTSGGNWLIVSPTSGTAPSTLTVTVNSAALAPGNYSGTITISAAGASNSPQAVSVQFTNLPTVPAGGLVNAASLIPRVAVAAGSIGALFGLNLASTTASATSVPLPTTLGGATVQINGVAVPLFFASPTQINFQIPWELLGQTPVTLTVTVGGLTSSPVTITLALFSPGIFSTNSSGAGQAAILIAGTATVAAPSGSLPGRDARPVKRGEEALAIFATGLGDVTNRPPTGAAALSNPLSTTLASPTVTLGGVSAPVIFSGLAPFLVGLYQVNVQVPANAPVGNTVEVVLTVGGIISNAVTIAVQ